MLITKRKYEIVEVEDNFDAQCVVIKIDGEEVAYIDESGINLLPECSKEHGIKLDKAGRLEVIKC